MEGLHQMSRFFQTLLLLMMSASAIATELQRGVDHLINQVDPSINMGMVVVDLNTGETLYQRQPDHPFIPASNMKLFSDAAALLALGPDYRFNSQLSTDATVLKKGVLKGSIYLHLPGDPSLTEDHLDTMLSSLPLWGIQRIQGNVVLSSNNRMVTAYAPGRMAEDNRYSYGAPIAPLVLNENRLSVTVNPAHRAGVDALIEFNQPNHLLSLNNQVKTVSNGTKCGVDFSMDHDNRLTIHGCVGIGQSSIQQLIPISNPFLYAQNLVRSNLKKRRIQLEGEVILGDEPTTSLLLSSHHSKPISQLMADTLKPSDNLYADSLFLHTATNLSGLPLDWQEAQSVIKHFLQQQTGISLQSAVLTDGSGLSRDDRLTPQQTVELLRFLYNHFPLSYEFIAALPIAGQDGTLQRRFRKPSQQGLLRAKTGTMTGIMSLSGYLYTANAHTLAFAIFINKAPGTKSSVSGRYPSLIDTLCDFLLQQKLKNQPFLNEQKSPSRVAFQQKPTQAEQQHKTFARWRQLESALKQSLQGEPVTVLFRRDQLVLQDKGRDPNTVWKILQTLSKTYAFSVALQSTTAPRDHTKAPFLLWIKTVTQGRPATKIWTLRESIHQQRAL
jgi:D-alanyl-D-alanine carboxypeptidase/D-alanyl-D-alanine-endopeptidase (penicillin-binding protein 4)